jgi:hydroxymethylglutaryl-CoA lyase
MSDIPTAVHLTEEGPREGFQIEKHAIPTARKIELIDALADTGLRQINIVSFVNPKLVPGMADADDVVRGITPRPGVAYTGLWLNARGFERALATGRLTVEGVIALSASEPFLSRNQNRTNEQHVADQHAMVELYQAHGVPISGGFIMAAFGCNFAGDVPVAHVPQLVGELVEIAAQHGAALPRVTLADTMGWATPLAVKRVVSAVRERFADIEVGLHLHDTRGMGIANAYAGLELGVAHFDASVAGLGGCPFAGHAGAAGNVCTEDLAFLCDELGVATGVDLERLVACAQLAEDIVRHPLPGSVMRGGALKRLRERLAVA